MQISEFMADPTPSSGLPITEFIELQNVSNTAIRIDEIAIASGGRAASAGNSGFLEPNDYLVLVPEDSLGVWELLGIPVAGIRLPGLTNTGDEITLLLRGDTIAQLRYTVSWYRDPGRDEGGYSLEYNGLGAVDCPGSWAASRDDTGGTPGKRNSVAGQLLDMLPPALITLQIDSGGFTLLFDEGILGLPDDIFFLDGEQLLPLRISDREFEFRIELNKGLIYSLLIEPDYTDCTGNFALDPIRYPLLLPAPLAPGDLLINEVLFDPLPGGSDFVELVNTTSNTLQLQGLLLDNTSSSGQPKRIEATYLLPPGELVVLTADAVDLVRRFPGTRPEAILETVLPALPNGGGNLTLFPVEGTSIDAFDYREAYHDELLNPTEGVSLERLSTDRPTNEPENWYSAASGSGYGTPTRPNSQRHLNNSSGATRFALANETFDPRGNGYPERMELQYLSPDPGLQATIRIFDIGGNLVRTLASVRLLGSSGSIYWDGTGDAGKKLPVGPYVVLIETFRAGGSTDRYKLVGILAG